MDGGTEVPPSISYLYPATGESLRLSPLHTDALSESIERGLLSDLEAEVWLKRFQVESTQAVIDLVLGTALMAMRIILEGQCKLNYPEQVTQLILKSLGVHENDADAIASKALEPFPKA